MVVETFDQRQIQSLRRLKPYQRIQLAFELFEVARARIAGEIKRLHPDFTKKDLQSEVNRRLIR
jgi:hypothetical protein